MAAAMAAEATAAAVTVQEVDIPAGAVTLAAASAEELLSAVSIAITANWTTGSSAIAAFTARPGGDRIIATTLSRATNSLAGATMISGDRRRALAKPARLAFTSASGI